MDLVAIAPDGKSVLTGLYPAGGGGLFSTEWSVNGFGSSAQIATVPNVDRNIVFHPSGSYAVMCTYDGYSNHPFLRVVSYNSVTSNYDIVTKPSSPTGQRQTLAFSTDGIILFMAGYQSLRAYAWDDINRVPGQLIHSIALSTSHDYYHISINSKTGDVLVCADTAGSKYGVVFIYPYSNGFGTKYTNPTNWLRLVRSKFSPDGNSIAITFGGTVEVYEWVTGTGFGALLSTKTYSPLTIVNVEFSPLGDALCVIVSGSPFVYMYEYNSTTGIGNEYPRPSPDFTYAPTLIAFN